MRTVTRIDYGDTDEKSTQRVLSSVKKGKIKMYGQSAGGRKIYGVFYGKPNNLHRTANLSSALGAKDKICYADKSGDYRKTVFLVGGTHGGEPEGIFALHNLISVMETGTDLFGKEQNTLYDFASKVNLIIIPCINPDGRARVPIGSFAGKTSERMHYYNQGTWKNGKLCNWPDCKKVHPIKDYAGFLGGYFNDDGINLMHDNFFGKKARETEILFDIANEYVPDLTVLLHSGGESGAILKPAYASGKIKERILSLEKGVYKHFLREGLPFYISDGDKGENSSTPPSFNLISAITQLCGEMCVTYESFQGLVDLDNISADKIHFSHLILFEEIFKFFAKEDENGDK